MTILAFIIGVITGAIFTLAFATFAFLRGWFDEPFVNRRDDEDDGL